MLISTLKNASNGRLTYIKCSKNNFSLRCLSILYQLGYIRGYTIINSRSVLIYLRYTSSGKSVIRQLALISKPSKHVYAGYRALKGAKLNNFVYSNSFVICSTPLGLFTDVESIILKHGGELVLYVA